VDRWECGNPESLAGFPSAAGNSLEEFSTARHLHRIGFGFSPLSVRTERSDADELAALVTSELAARRSAGFDSARQFPRELPASGPILLRAASAAALLLHVFLFVVQSSAASALLTRSVRSGRLPFRIVRLVRLPAATLPI
jgi:hypothetical protein